jgi:SAM-dependent methyltransferase
MIAARTVGIVASNGEQVQALRTSLEAAGLVGPAAEITHFEVAYTVPVQKNGPIRRRHLLWDKVDGDFDLIACSTSVRFFESLWTKAFITLLIRSCKKGGLIIIPQCRGPETSPNIYVSAAWLKPLLADGDAGRIAHYVCFRRPDMVGGDFPSMLLWARNHVEDEEVRRYVSGPESMDPSTVGRLTQGGLPIRIDSRFEEDLSDAAEFGSRADVFGDPASAFLRTLSYWIGGLAYKTPAIAHVARLCGLQHGASLLDCGGGVGHLAIDCVLDPECPIKRATTVDLSPGNALIFERIARDLRPALKGRVGFTLGSFASWLPDEPVDMIACLAALMYLPRAQVNATLSAWWDKLKPGGVLLIHENIRQPDTPPRRDLDMMFDSEELNGKLQPLGEQRFLAATAMRELSAADGAGKSVFRFIQKTR